MEWANSTGVLILFWAIYLPIEVDHHYCVFVNVILGYWPVVAIHLVYKLDLFSFE